MPLEFANALIYTVQARDTLTAIANAHGVSLDALVAANAGIVGDPSLIQPGWELVIPGELGGTRRGAAPAGTGVAAYTVEAGDSLAGLAGRWGTTVESIAELNGITNPSLIFVGQRIRRPGDAAVPHATVAVAAQPEADVRGRLEFVRWPLDVPPAVVTGGYRQDYGNYLHRGIDLGGVPVGTPVFAPAAGIIAVHRPGDAWGNGSFGINVVIDHPGTPWWSIYAHMLETTRTTGESVAAGDIIGAVGFTGFVVPEGPAGAHLHWQLSAHSGFPQGFEYIANPLDFLAT
ncbi:MAG: M23 family metallopeptidase [Dehalococcoidia bacterium]|nr:M23 family metallopeptidase [Dehalococcoidia bacterium]